MHTWFHLAVLPLCPSHVIFKSPAVQTAGKHTLQRRWQYKYAVLYCLHDLDVSATIDSLHVAPGNSMWRRERIEVRAYLRVWGRTPTVLCSCLPCYMYVTCMVHVLYMCGTCVVHVWYMYGTCVVHVWYMFYVSLSIPLVVALLQSQVYNELALYFPSHMTQPKSNVEDLISVTFS